MLYAKTNGSQLLQFPITGTDIVLQNPTVSFPTGELSPATMRGFGCVEVTPTPQPEVDAAHNLNRTAELRSGTWVEIWNITEASPEEIAIREEQRLQQRDAQRAQAYKQESDPIFFRWQRNEATEQEWLDKIAEIKARYP